MGASNGVRAASGTPRSAPRPSRIPRSANASRESSPSRLGFRYEQIFFYSLMKFQGCQIKFFVFIMGNHFFLGHDQFMSTMIKSSHLVNGPDET